MTYSSLPQRRNAKWRPSGDHARSPYWLHSGVTRVKPVPSAFTTWTRVQYPPFELAGARTNAIRRPEGDQLGEMSFMPRGDVIFFKPLPSARTTWRA